MKDLIRNLKLSWKYAKGEKNRLIFFTIGNIFSVVLKIIFPIVGAKYTISLVDNDLERLLYMGLIMLLLDLLVNLFRYIINNLAIKIYQTTFNNLGKELGKNILMLENECLEKKEVVYLYQD